MVVFMADLIGISLVVVVAVLLVLALMGVVVVSDVAGANASNRWNPAILAEVVGVAAMSIDVMNGLYGTCSMPSCSST